MQPASHPQLAHRTDTNAHANAPGSLTFAFNLPNLPRRTERVDDDTHEKNLKEKQHKEYSPVFREQEENIAVSSSPFSERRAAAMDDPLAFVTVAPSPLPSVLTSPRYPSRMRLFFLAARAPPLLSRQLFMCQSKNGG